MTSSSASSVVDAACAGRGDADVRAYVATCLADEDFDWEEEENDDGDDADLLAAAVAKALSSTSTQAPPSSLLLSAASAVRASFGEMLSGAECCTSKEDEARVCAELALKLCPKEQGPGHGGDDGSVANGGGGSGGVGGSAEAPAAAEAAAASG